MTVCARCRRTLTRAPIVVAGQGYGPSCAALVGDLLTQPVKRKSAGKPRQRVRDGQPELFSEVRP